MKHLWSIESWGSDYPPENADEIISKANDLIEAYAEDHDEDEVNNFSETLWERYCSTGNI